jgi:hypothetical protein
MSGKKKGSSSGTRNEDRNNGKAWKKAKPPKAAPTFERVMKNYEVLLRRQRTKEENIARREAERAAAEFKAAQEAEEAELAKLHNPIGIAVKTKRKQQPIAA